jgi:DAK2 domain fusion protein YloV
MAIPVCDGHLFKEALLGSVAWLTANREEVDALNVFPVPDGDTGTNMLLTLQSAVEDIHQLDDEHLGRVVKQAAHGALMGARGNSGVILSQIFRGMAQSLENEAAVDGRGLAEALTSGATVAHRAVMKPTEGTMLTVAREAANGARARAAETADLTEVTRAACDAARVAVERTPEQLEILRRAGVVDAGGFGLQLILEGFLKRLQGEPAVAFARPAIQHAAPRAIAAPDTGWGYCTEFIINGSGLPVDEVRAEIARRGESALIVGDDSAIKVHVHTHEPAAVMAYAQQLGALSRIKVDDMSAQHHRLQGEVSRKPRSLKHLGIVAVASGRGFQRILESLGVDSVVEGGQSMNPSTEDLLAAVESVPAADLLLLPNNGNVIMTAQQVPPLTPKRVRVIPSRSLPEGVAALLAFDFTQDLEANAVAMARALRQVRTVEITTAVRASTVDGLQIQEGDVIGLLNDRVVAAGPVRQPVIDQVMARLDPLAVQTITIYAGAEAPADEREAIRRQLAARFAQSTIELQAGEQALYPYIIAVE